MATKPIYSPLVRVNARKLLEVALKLAKAGEEDPVIVAGVERKASLAGATWECAYNVRTAARLVLRRASGSLTSQRVLGKAIELLNNGWGS